MGKRAPWVVSVDRSQSLNFTVNSYTIWILTYTSMSCSLETFTSCQGISSLSALVERKLWSTLPMKKPSPDSPAVQLLGGSTLLLKAKSHTGLLALTSSSLPTHTNLVSSHPNGACLIQLVFISCLLMEFMAVPDTFAPSLLLEALSSFGDHGPYYPDFPPPCMDIPFQTPL